MVKYTYTFFAISLLTSLLSQVFATDVNVTIHPKTFDINKGASLSITINDGRLNEIPSPVTPTGISVHFRGQQRSFSFFNGSRSQSTTLQYVVTAAEVGEYTIEPFDIQINGQTVKTQPVKFEVTGTAAPSSNTPLVQPQSNANTNDSPPGFLNLDFFDHDTDSLYVGEMIPVRIRAFFPYNTPVVGNYPIKPEGSGFTLHNLSEQSKTTEQINGEYYSVYSWYGSVSFVRSGEVPIQVSTISSILVRDNSRRGFGSLFSNLTTTKEFKFETSSKLIKVIPLPEKGRPENFNGLVGSFKMEGYSLPVDGNTGEAQNIHVTISGSGNFDRMTAPVLEPKEKWKTYTPKAEFDPHDLTSFSGKKTFRFNAVAQKPGPMKLYMGLSYFDPQSEQYHEIRSAEVDANISGESIVPKQAATTTEEPTNQPSIQPLAFDRKIRKGGTSLIPLTKRAYFWGVLGSIILISVGLGVWQWLNYRHHSPSAIAQRRARLQTSATDAEIEAATHTNDPQEFFGRAQNAIKQRAASLWDINPAAITLADLKRRLPADSPVLKIFAKGDALAYGGSLDSSESLSNWQTVFREAMQSLTEKK